jgi:hypothetical protein
MIAKIKIKSKYYGYEEQLNTKFNEVYDKILLVYAWRNMNFNPSIIVERNRVDGILYFLKFSRSRLAKLVHKNGGPNASTSAINSPRNPNQNAENKCKKKLHFGRVLLAVDYRL